MKNPFISPFITALPRWFGGFVLLIGLLVLPNAIGMIAVSYEDEKRPTFENFFELDNIRNIIQLGFAYLGLGLASWCFYFAVVILVFHDKKADVQTE